jgi:alkylated DNA repair protein (DNA oxidative demethylase)
MSAPQGFRLLPGRLDLQAQQALAETVLALVQATPPAPYRTPGGRAMSVAMTSLGSLGWVSDHRGYRYEAVHPATGRPWPPIPQSLLDLWSDLADPEVPPDSCLVNLYRGPARMGLHQDRDEADLTWPVLSISLGDTAIFRIGGPERLGPTASLRLASGDVCLLSGAARLAHHGVDRILPGSSRLIPGGGRINLTLRRAGVAA